MVGIENWQNTRYPPISFFPPKTLITVRLTESEFEKLLWDRYRRLRVLRLPRDTMPLGN